MIRVCWEHPDAVALREQMVSEISALYARDLDPGRRDGELALDPATIVLTGLLYEGGMPIAHVALRRLAEDFEIKRMFVIPDRRGRGISKQLLEEAERAAREEGAKRVILHTGARQPAALELYRGHGYTEIPVYPPYIGVPDSICFEKAL